MTRIGDGAGRTAPGNWGSHRRGTVIPAMGDRTGSHTRADLIHQFNRDKSAGIVKRSGTFRGDHVTRRAPAFLEGKFLRLPLKMPMLLWLAVGRVDYEVGDAFGGHCKNFTRFLPRFQEQNRRYYPDGIISLHPMPNKEFPSSGCKMSSHVDFSPFQSASKRGPD